MSAPKMGSLDDLYLVMTTSLNSSSSSSSSSSLSKTSATRLLSAGDAPLTSSDNNSFHSGNCNSSTKTRVCSGGNGSNSSLTAGRRGVGISGVNSDSCSSLNGKSDREKLNCIISLWKKKDPENPEMPQEDPALVGLSLKPLNRANTVATGLGTGTRKLQQQAHANRAAAAVANMNCIRSANDPINRQRQRLARGDGDGEKFKSFCRGSLKRLKNAEDKVSTAKKDMEQILADAKSESDLSTSASPPYNGSGGANTPIKRCSMSRRPSSFKIINRYKDGGLLPASAAGSNSNLLQADGGGGSGSPAKNNNSSEDQAQALLDLDRSRLEDDAQLANEAHQEMKKILTQFVNLLHEEEERIAKQADCLQRRSSMMKFNYVNTRSKVNNSNSSNVGSGSSSNADNTTAVTAAANSPTSPSTPADSAEQDTEAEIHLEDDNLK